MIWKRNSLLCWVNAEVAVEQPLISIVIVNYNSGDWLRRCLSYVAEQTYPHWEVIVVDNASQDDSLARVNGFDRLRIIRNQDNRGFAAAQNQGILAGQGTYIMPLNFDIRMTPTYLSAMVAALESDQRIGSVCGKLLKMTPDWQPTQEIDTTGLLMQPSLIAVSRGHGQTDIGQFDQQSLIFGAQGAAPLYRREMLEDIAFEGQFFDARYFMWYEDVDLDWRAYLRGWECRFAPRAVAYHLGHPNADRQTAFHVQTTVRNRWLMLLTNLGRDELKDSLLALLKHEIGLLLYVLRIGRLSAYLSALVALFSHRSYIVAKRRWVRSRAARPLWREKS